MMKEWERGEQNAAALTTTALVRAMLKEMDAAVRVSIIALALQELPPRPPNDAPMPTERATWDRAKKMLEELR